MRRQSALALSWLTQCLPACTLKRAALLLLAISLAMVCVAPARAMSTTMYTPPDETIWATQNPRIVELPSGNLLATFGIGDDTGWNNKLYRSTDLGATWTDLGRVLNSHPGIDAGGLWAPDLIVMPSTVGNITAGTLLFAGKKAHAGGVYIDLYKSTNEGNTWQFVTSVVYAPDANIWEPALVVDNSATKRLLCYYADERNMGTAQKIVYQAWNPSNNTWGAITNVLTMSGERPGMPRITKMGNGQYLLAYERLASSNNGIYFKTATDGYSWGTTTVPGTKIVSLDNQYPHQCPSVMWIADGRTNGTLIVTSMNQVSSTTRGSDNFVNYGYATGNWYRVRQPLPYDTTQGNSPGWSRVVTPSSNGSYLYHVNCVDYNADQNEVMYALTISSYSSGSDYQIISKNQASGIRPLLEVYGGSTQDNATVGQWSENDGAWQRWTTSDSGTDGYVKIINSNSGKALSISGGSTADGALAVQRTWTGATDQLWKLVPAGGTSVGLFHLENKKSSKWLKILNNSQSNGAVAEQRTSAGDVSMRWQLNYLLPD